MLWMMMYHKTMQGTNLSKSASEKIYIVKGVIATDSSILNNRVTKLGTQNIFT